jgi:hypothetical protein
MRLPRMTTRRWMIAVAIVAIALATVLLSHRHLWMGERGDYHERIERRQADRARGLGQLAVSFTDSHPEMAARLRAHATFEAELGDQHARLKEKYRSVARYPWLTIEPEPPEPKNPFDLEALHNKFVGGSQ